MANSSSKYLFDDPEDMAPGLAIRRHTDRCFFEVEEKVPGGYILEGIMVSEENVAEVRSLKREEGEDNPLCEAKAPTL